MRIPSILMSVMLLAAGSASAQSTAPGLWEIRNRMGGNPEMEKAMADMQQQLAAMPPAQRQQMEAMMRQNGMSVGAGGAMTLKVCITPEMAARAELPSQTEGDCTMTVVSRSGNTLKSKFVCQNPPSTGEGSFTLSGDKAYTSHMVMRTTRNGKPETLTVDGDARWLSASCGNVKPLAPPKK